MSGSRPHPFAFVAGNDASLIADGRHIALFAPAQGD